MIVSELIEILQQLPQDSIVITPHLYRLKAGGLRQIACDISSVVPCYDQDTNKIMFYTINPVLNPDDIK